MGWGNSWTAKSMGAVAINAPEKIDTLYVVRPQDAPAVWPRVERYLWEANEHGGDKIMMHDWLAKILVGAADLMVSADCTSAVIGEPQQFPRRRVYGVILMGGEGGHDWQRYQRLFEQQAKIYGCDAIEIFGRKGWKPVLEQQLGYSFAHWVWRKEI